MKPTQCEQYDVTVVGAGAAGIAAAIAAARSGAKTLLLEAEPRVGGNISNAFVHTICGLYQPLEESDSVLRYANEGFPRELAEGLIAAGIANPPERAGKVAFLPIDPLAFSEFALQLCQRTPNLDLALESPLRHATLPTQIGVAGTLHFASLELQTRIAIDTSGDGTLGALAGADFAVANQEELQTTSYTTEIAGVDCDALQSQKLGTLKLSTAIAHAAKHGALPTDAASVNFRSATQPGHLYLSLNLPRMLTHQSLLQDRDTQARSETLEQARTLTQRVLEFLQHHEPAFAKGRLHAEPTHIGVRETRRLLGRCVLDETALLDGVRREDEVALSAWPIELWQDHRRASFQYPRSACSIPLGALISRSHPQLGMAGRCISATHEALGALRVIGTALATGEAIGIAAALAAKENLPLAAIDPARIRAHIQQHAKEMLQK